MALDLIDANGVVQTLATDVAAGQHTPRHTLVVNSAPVTNANPIPFQGVPVTLTNRSGSITTGGTAQQSAAANSARTFLFIQNPDTATDLYVSLVGTASSAANSGSIRLAPGAGMTFDMRVPAGAVSVFSATTGKGFVVYEA